MMRELAFLLFGAVRSALHHDPNRRVRTDLFRRKGDVIQPKRDLPMFFRSILRLPNATRVGVLSFLAVSAVLWLGNAEAGPTSSLGFAPFDDLVGGTSWGSQLLPAVSEAIGCEVDPPDSVDTPPAGRGRGGGRQNQPSRNLRNVLGGVPMTLEDCIVAEVVGRLDFDSYKEILRGLTAFGDREQGTERNAQAIDWIEAQLQSWGYETERLQYTYTPRSREGEPDPVPEPREEVYATKIGSTTPGEMYIIGAHMDGHGFGAAANDDGSGTALVLELARILNSPDVETEMSIRFILFNNEETGGGARAYVQQRNELQGIEDPPGSGQYPEPRWVGMIQHDMMLWDHGMPGPDGQVSPEQRREADVNIEFAASADMADEAQELAWFFRTMNDRYATDYPAAVGDRMSNTDSGSFQNYTAAISLRENERLAHTGSGWNPTWHQPIDVFETFSDKDFTLGLNAAQTTLAGVASLAGATIRR